MSRRFGRQQKRRMLAHIASLEKECNDLQLSVDAVKHSARRNEDIIAKTAETLGEYFITLDPEIIELRSLKRLGDYWEDAAVNPKMTVVPGFPSEFVAQSVVEIRRLPVLKCRAFLEELRGAVHYRFTFNGREAGYSVSQAAITNSPGFRQAVARNISEAVTRVLLDTEVNNLW